MNWPWVDANVAMPYLFLDTEWADAAGEKLVNLALVSDDGTYEFYAEIDPLPEFPNWLLPLSLATGAITHGWIRTGV